MLRFYAASFISTTSLMARVTFALDPPPGDPALAMPVVRIAIEELGEALQELPLSPVTMAQYERLKQKANGDSTGTYESSILMRELHENIIVELSSKLFLLIPANHRINYEQPDPLFGNLVADECYEANYNIAEAGRCLSLERWTACVFHLMRVLEIGLRKTAVQLGLPMSGTAEFENWKNIIDQIEKKIREFEALPKSVEKADMTQFYSEVATGFRYFKDAWRNHVSHSRATYDEEQATVIWGHVRTFMQSLANHPIAQSNNDAT